MHKLESGIWVRDRLVRPVPVRERLRDERGFMPGLMPIIGPQGGLTLPGTPVLWFKTPIAGLSHDDDVTSWPNDGSAGGNGSGSSDGTSKPKYKSSSNTINSLPTVWFGDNVADATNVFYSINTSAWSAATMYVVAVKAADPATSDTVSGWMTTVSQLVKSHLPYTDSIIYDNSFTTVRKTVGNPTPSLASPFYYGIFSASGDWRARLNGSEIFSTGTNTFEGQAGGGGSSNFTIGVSRESGGSRRASESYVAEVVVYDSILSAGDITAAEAYFAARYAI